MLPTQASLITSSFHLLHLISSLIISMLPCKFRKPRFPPFPLPEIQRRWCQRIAIRENINVVVTALPATRRRATKLGQGIAQPVVAACTHVGIVSAKCARRGHLDGGLVHSLPTGVVGVVRSAVPGANGARGRCVDLLWQRAWHLVHARDPVIELLDKGGIIIALGYTFSV